MKSSKYYQRRKKREATDEAFEDKAKAVFAQLMAEMDMKHAKQLKELYSGQLNLAKEYYALSEKKALFTEQKGLLQHQMYEAKMEMMRIAHQAELKVQNALHLTEKVEQRESYRQKVWEEKEKVLKLNSELANKTLDYGFKELKSLVEGIDQKMLSGEKSLNLIFDGLRKNHEGLKQEILNRANLEAKKKMETYTKRIDRARANLAQVEEEVNTELYKLRRLKNGK